MGKDIKRESYEHYNYYYHQLNNKITILTQLSCLRTSTFRWHPPSSSGTMITRCRYGDQRIVAVSEIHKSAITDHVATDNHVMDWDNIRVLDREEDRTRRWIKEAIWIRRSVPVMNRDEGGYQLSHIYDSLITIPTSGDHSS